MAFGFQRLNCEGKITNGAEITIDTQNAWQHLTNITEGENCNGLSVATGITKSITAFADAGGGQVTVTANGHGIEEGDYVSITGTTNYNGLYQISNVAENTFRITAAWVANDATGTVRHGVHVEIPTGGGGDYIYLGTVCATASTANTTFEFSFLLNNVTNGITRRKFSTNTDVGALSMLGFFHATPGDHLCVGIRNITSGGEITINEAQFVIFKIS
jgi:hypothetical protein